MDIQDQLAAWGQWVLADGTGLGYNSPMAAIMRGHVIEPRKRHTARYISDDDALQLEQHITLLCKHEPLAGKVLKLKYIEKMSDSAIAREYLTPLKYGKDSDKKVSAYQAANYISYAEGFIIASIVIEQRQ